MVLAFGNSEPASPTVASASFIIQVHTHNNKLAFKTNKQTDKILTLATFLLILNLAKTGKKTCLAEPSALPDRIP